MAHSSLKKCYFRCWLTLVLSSVSAAVHYRSTVSTIIRLNTRHLGLSDLPCCCCPYLEQSASSNKSRSHPLSVFSGRIEAIPLQAFIPIIQWLSPRLLYSACALTVVIFGHFNRSFYLLTVNVDTSTRIQQSSASVAAIKTIIVQFLYHAVIITRNIHEIMCLCPAD